MGPVVGTFYVYTFKNNESKFLVKPIPTHCSQWEENKFPIEKDPEKRICKNYFKVWKDEKRETKLEANNDFCLIFLNYSLLSII